jgi:predicted MFS family arabinose efflux permease
VSLAGISGFLGLNRNIGILLATIVLIAAGEEMWVRFIPKYLEVLGASAFAIGSYDAIKTLLGAVYAYPGGIIVDRWGHRAALGGFTLVSIAGYLLLLAIPHWTTVLAATVLFLAWSTLSLPATFTLVAESLPSDKHAMGIGVQSLVRRLPVIIGPVAGGILIDRFGFVQGIRYGLLASIVASGMALALQRQIRIPARKHAVAREGLWRALGRSSPELRGLLVSDILVRFCERIPFAWVVIYAMDVGGVTAAQMGILIAIEMAAAIACYLPSSWLADRYGKEPFVIATFVFFTLFPIALSFSHSFATLAVAFAIRGLKEFGDPARKALILHYAAEGSKGQAVGAYYLLRDIVVTAGAFLGAWLWKLGPQYNFWGAALIGAVGTLVYIRKGYRRAGA